MIPAPPNCAEDAETQSAPVAMVGSYEYLGVLSLPSLGLELPVMADWDYERLKLAPCRQFGSAETDDLVIAGHNYIGHFANLGMLKAGDSVTFTTMDGAVIAPRGVRAGGGDYSTKHPSARPKGARLK